MAKYRHRTFEMFDFLDEARCALASKSTRSAAAVDDSESWSLEHLVALRQAGVIHVKFKKGKRLATELSSELRTDFSQLADSLVNDSRVLMDFECLDEFGSGCIDELKRFNAKLQSKGSRMVLCNLESVVRAAFFPNRSGNEHESKSLRDNELR